MNLVVMMSLWIERKEEQGGWSRGFPSRTLAHLMSSSH